jgi:CheY-like chemotaxis protein
MLQATRAGFAAAGTGKGSAGPNPLAGGGMSREVSSSQVSSSQVPSSQVPSSQLPSQRASHGGDLPVAKTRTVVMVVDDDDAIREALQDVLGDEGYDVIAASDGQQALEFLHEEKRPSVILVDLWMPVMDGWKFLDALLQNPRFSQIPLVVLTAAREQRARDLQVAEVLTKPVQLDQVLAVLERLTA